MFDLAHGFLFFLIGGTVTFVGFFIAYMIAGRSQEKPKKLTDIEKQLEKLKEINTL
jgi:heme/copper-type cytochrome/quinol oxidase subunit 3